MLLKQRLPTARFSIVLIALALSSGCAASSAFKRGKKFDMGQGCLRFKTLDDLALDAIGEVIQRLPAKTLIAMHEAAHGNKTGRSQSRRRATREGGRRNSSRRTG